MSLTKISGYLFVTLLIYLLVCAIASITPIFMNVLGLATTNESVLSKQQEYYFRAPMRSIIQGDAGCVEADSELGYRQKLGDCHFKNFEFDTILKFDENGSILDSSNQSNSKSKIIVVGDSHAMGWGVSYNETFSYILSKYGYQVTNLSMSSYGTEQEILSAISNKNFSSADTIIIQYCNNDFGKNEKDISEYLEKEFNHYKKIKKSEFTIINKLHNAARFYLRNFSTTAFFKFPFQIIKSSLKDVEQPTFDSIKHKEFVNNIISKYDDLSTKKIIIFYANGHGAKFHNWNESLQGIDFVDLNLKRFHYNLIDDHLNKNGHDYIANSLHRLLTVKK